MSAHELDKETYRSIIETYFRSFGTRDFSQVQFSSQVQFLSPTQRHSPERTGGD